METRALAIAFFYAVGTAVGGITGPLLFGNLIGSGHRGSVAIAFYIGAAVMALGGVAEIAFGVKAEGEQLEDIARPLTADDADQGSADTDDGGGGGAEEGNHRDENRYRTGQEEATVGSRPGRPLRSIGRIRPGPGSQTSRVMGYSTPLPHQVLHHEVAAIERALTEHGPMDRHEIYQRTGAQFWGPGVLREALRQAVSTGLIVKLSGSTFGPVQPRGDSP
jgi:hypothetical protein